jgi:hypothetical protein
MSAAPSYELIASWFLRIVGVAFLGGFGLPLLFMPLRWARLLRWRIPADTDLTIYFARCLGGVTIAITVVFLTASAEPRAHRALFLLGSLAGALLTAVHLAGAIQRAQPAIETAEIGLFATAAGLSLWLFLRLGG